MRRVGLESGRGKECFCGNAEAASIRLIAQLTRERDELRRELDKAMLVIGVQKKLATLLDTLSDAKSEKP